MPGTKLANCAVWYLVCQSFLEEEQARRTPRDDTTRDQNHCEHWERRLRWNELPEEDVDPLEVEDDNTYEGRLVDTAPPPWGPMDENNKPIEIYVPTPKKVAFVSPNRKEEDFVKRAARLGFKVTRERPKGFC